MEKNIRGVILAFAAGALLLAPTAEAVPNFARKYDISCNVCHTREPRLNAFGQRFQENGYQLPGTEDGSSTKKRQFGNPRHKLTLDSVSNFLSARIRADVQQVQFREKTEASEDVDFVVPNIINVFIAGTAYTNIGYFFEVEFAPGEGEGHEELLFERAFVVFSNLGKKHQALNVKIGSFDPSAFYAFPTHRQQMNPIFPDAHTEEFPPEINRIPIIPLAFSTKMFGLTTGPDHVDDDGFAILPFEPYLFNAPASTGAAIYGRPGEKGFFYQLGVVQEETAEDEPETRYDFHAMLRYDPAGGQEPGRLHCRLLLQGARRSAAHSGARREPFLCRSSRLGTLRPGLPAAAQDVRHLRHRRVGRDQPAPVRRSSTDVL